MTPEKNKLFCPCLKKKKKNWLPPAVACLGAESWKLASGIWYNGFGKKQTNKQTQKDQGWGTESIEGLGHRQNGEVKGGEGWAEWCARVHGCILPGVKLNPG